MFQCSVFPGPTKVLPGRRRLGDWGRRLGGSSGHCSSIDSGHLVMASSDSPRRGSIPTEKTKKEERIERNKAKMGSLLIRKGEGLRGVSSGSIVRVKSEHYPNCKWCLLTSVSPAGEIQVNGYEIEFWNSKLSKSKRLKLKKIAQPTQCFRSKDGLVLIPLESRVFGNIRTFPTAYYNIEDSDEVKLHCYVMGTGMNSLAGESFTLVGRTKKDNQGKLQYDYELHADDGIVCKTHKDFKTHLFPRGGVILKGEGLQATCVGVLNFSSEGLISPVFFTRETLTRKFILFNTIHSFYFIRIQYILLEVFSSIAFAVFKGLAKLGNTVAETLSLVMFPRWLN